ncbi:hypothetical protein ACSVH2_04950 [Flavobacterium sp. RSB2_4_14]|uniref:hypothetical protein n=1 Tax=Flavobacterium sp. RSB2_4_14 TaxID=3447665 RepID=UPI003F354751
MRKATQFLLLVSLFILTFTSCSNDSDTSNVVLLNKVTAVTLGQQSEYTFSYSGTKLNRVDFEIQALTDGVGYDKYYYTNDLITQIKRFNAANQNTANTVFTYNTNKQLTQVVRVVPSNNYGFKSVFTYNSDGTVLMTGYYGDITSQNTLSGTTEKYYFQNGEVSQKDFNTNSFSSSVTYNYDTANHPMQNVTGLDAIKLYTFIGDGLFGFKHNVIQQTTYITPGVVDNQVVFEANYNTNNYPTAISSSATSPGGYQYSFQYFK